VDITTAKFGHRVLDHVALPPAAAKPHFKCVKNKSSSKLYQVVEMLCIKVCVCASLKFMGKRVNFPSTYFLSVV
jgi:hypothetical protein